MRATLQHFAQICSENMLTEKILIVPSYRIGHQIVESLAFEGASVVNLRNSTVLGLALEAIGDEMARKGLTLISEESRLSLVEEIFENSIYKKDGLYFNDLEAGPGIIAALSNSINDLRLADIKPADLRLEQFVSKEKFRGFSLLLQLYEEDLVRNKQIDEAGVYQLIRQADLSMAQADRMFLVCPDLSLTNLEKDCLDRISGGNYTILRADAIIGLERPRYFLPSTPSGAVPENLLAWILAPNEIPKGQISMPLAFFHAIGVSTEVKEVIRRILKERIPFDKVEVACVDYATYAFQFFLEQQKREIAFTFSNGIPCQQTRPGKSLVGLLDWVGSDYSFTPLRHLIASNVLVRTEYKRIKAPSAQGVIRVLRSAGIGWGRNRYVERLKALKGKYETERDSESAEEDGDTRPREWFNEKISQVEWVLAFVEEILSCLPASSEAKIAEGKLVEGLAAFLDKFCPKIDELDRLAFATLKTTVQELGTAGHSERPLKDVIDKLRMRIDGLLVGGSGPKPGHIHVASLHKAGYSVRPFHFVVGLDEHRFPGVSMEDPVLLDSERKQISPHLRLSSDRFEELNYRMYSYLSSLKGEVTLSYASYDIVEGREVFPSPVLLQAYRIAKAQPTLDYTTMRQELGAPVGFAGTSPGDETEWWVHNFLAHKPSPAYRENVLKAFPQLARGAKALKKRNSTDFTAYDGRVRVDPGLVDPRKNQKLTMSCSRIEKIAECPFGYFVTYVLGLKPPEDMEYDPTQWLEAKDRGSMLHGIYEEFMRSMSKQETKVSAAKHKDLLFEIATRHILDMKSQVPPPSEHVFESEKNDVLADLEVFLKMEDAIAANERPQYFEVSFGLQKPESGEIGLEEPAQITIGVSSFHLRGRIDRIDKLGEHKYQVVDYKTGSTYGFSSKGYFEQGKKIQHCLYARVTDTILRGIDSKARVTLSGYYFPTRKGKALKVLREQNQASRVDDIMNLLFDLVAHGVFLHSETGCFLCRDYGLCGNTKEHFKLKTEGSTDEDIQLLLKLEEYE